MASVEELLQRWTSAGILDAATAERIRGYELGQQRPAGMRWQVILALAFGGILLAAGVTLFVAAHWDELSPSARFAVVLLMLVVLHGAAIALRGRLDKLAITLHAVGTIAAGAGVFLVGQIFNLQEHWPTGILLWALCALAGWALLCDQVQQTIAMLLVPAWILSDWWVRHDGYRDVELLGLRMLAAFAALYLTAFTGAQKKVVSGVLFTAGAVALTISMPLLADGADIWYSRLSVSAMPWNVALLGWCWIIVVPIVAAWRWRPAAMVPLLVVVLSGLVLPHILRNGNAGYGRPSILTFLWIALLACFFAWWGVRERSRALINYGIIAFALTVLWFYFSSVMGKLGRSFSLIVLGLLFLGGGWLLEKMRRRLVSRVAGAA